jgi:hypothetical protein
MQVQFAPYEREELLGCECRIVDQQAAFFRRMLNYIGQNACNSLILAP